ncbi:MAG: hypothetical protein LBS54_05795 [Dysgonamonadaceae bacterium]|jgi:hypothetical protein|nr:hypothetical protein [Dysgonamonadaceae bacterium]
METKERAKRSTTETGTATNIFNCNKLVGIIIGFGPTYQPPNPQLEIENMQKQAAEANQAMNDVDYWLATYKLAEDSRKSIFDKLLPTVTRVLGVAVAARLPENNINHIKELVHKMRGVRKKPIEIIPLEPGEDPQKHISVSQTSFTAQIEHLNKLIIYLAQIPKYTPSEQDLTINGLNSLRDEMGATNDATTAADRTLYAMRRTRDELMYAKEIGLVPTALAAKQYIKAIFGATSWQYKEVSGIKFRNIKTQKIIIVPAQTYVDKSKETAETPENPAETQ